MTEREHCKQCFDKSVFSSLENNAYAWHIWKIAWADGYLEALDFAKEKADELEKKLLESVEKILKP